VTLADFEPSADYARALDSQDELAPMREQFAIPQRQRSDVAYLCGHSLGLMPLRTRQHVTRELDRWADRGVDGHFDEGGWYAFHERFAAPLAGLLGTGPDNIVAMNSLTVNLHLMLVSFFAPAGRRRKILI
jgi:kynureninase